MKKSRDDEVEREIRTHLDFETEERVADGMSATDARYAARRAFGNVTRTQEGMRAVWTRRWLDEMVQDVRYALRTPPHEPWIHQPAHDHRQRNDEHRLAKRSADGHAAAGNCERRA